MYSILKEAIISGKYEPNHWLQEVEIAEALGVSRSPVREALKQLVAAGLATEIPNKGTFVRDFSDKEIEEIFEIRELMETYAIMHLPKELGKEQIRQLEMFKRDFKLYHDADNMDMYIDVDSDFHKYIIECANNSILYELYKKVGNMNMLFRIYSLQTEQRFNESQVEHTQIIDCLISGDYGKAAAINRSHLSYARETAGDQISKKEGTEG